MDKDKLKLIVQNLESLVECLKSEIYSDVDSYKFPQYEQVKQHLTDYDEVFYDDDDDYDDVKINQRYRIMNDDDGDGI